MVDPESGTPVGGRRAVEETLEEGVPAVSTDEVSINDTDNNSTFSITIDNGFAVVEEQ